jgi:N-acetylglucosaminylphosphatidylinositol deacetylase
MRLLTPGSRRHCAMSRFLLAFLALILALLYAALSPAVTSRFEPFDFSINASTRVLLVTAHPDDECMFFAPTILTLVARKVEVHSLCLSVGDQDGLGDIRRSELEKSLDVLGISKDKRMVVDSPYVWNSTFAS